MCLILIEVTYGNARRALFTKGITHSRGNTGLSSFSCRVPSNRRCSFVTSISSKGKQNPGEVEVGKKALFALIEPSSDRDRVGLKAKA